MPFSGTLSRAYTGARATGGAQEFSGILARKYSGKRAASGALSFMLWSKVANPSTLPTGTSPGVAFNHDGSLMAVAHYTSPYVTIYNTSDWSKVANPSSLPTGAGYGVAFNHDGSLMAVAHAGSPYITIYNTSAPVARKLSLKRAISGSMGAFAGVVDWALTGLQRAVAGILSMSGAVTRAVHYYRPTTGVLETSGAVSRAASLYRSIAGSLDIAGTVARKLTLKRATSGIMGALSGALSWQITEAAIAAMRYVSKSIARRFTSKAATYRFMTKSIARRFTSKEE